MKKLDQGTLDLYEGNMSRAFSSTGASGTFHIIDVEVAESAEKIAGLCGEGENFYLDDIAKNPELILMNDWQVSAAKTCPKCVDQREEIIRQIAEAKAKVAKAEAEEKAKADAKALAKAEKEKAKADAEQTPSPAKKGKKKGK